MGATVIRTRRWRLATALLAIGLLVAIPATALAVNPGSNGRIAYSVHADPGQSGYEERGLYLVNPDGSDRQLVDVDGQSPAWSPDGTRLAYVRLTGSRQQCSAALYVAQGDGSGAKRILDLAPGDCVAPSLSWSVANEIVFAETTPQQGRPGEAAAAGEPGVVQPDGTGARPFFSSGAHDAGWRSATGLEWSPSGDRVIFSSPGVNDPASGFPNNGPRELYLADSAGNVVGALTTSGPYGAGDSAPSWSPNGMQLLFLRSSSDPTPQLWSMNSDGSGQALLDPMLRRSVWSPDGTQVASVVGQTGPLVAGPPGGKTGCVASWPGGTLTGVAWQPTNHSEAPRPVPDRECTAGLKLTAKKKQGVSKPILVEATAAEQCALTVTGTVKPAGEPEGKLKYQTAKLQPDKSKTLKLKPEKDVAAALAKAGKGKAKIFGVCSGEASQATVKVTLK